MVGNIFLSILNCFVILIGHKLSKVFNDLTDSNLYQFARPLRPQFNLVHSQTYLKGSRAISNMVNCTTKSDNALLQWFAGENGVSDDQLQDGQALQANIVVSNGATQITSVSRGNTIYKYMLEDSYDTRYTYCTIPTSISLSK